MAPKRCIVSGRYAWALPENSRCEQHKLKAWSRKPARPDLDSAWSRLSLRLQKAFPVCEVHCCSMPSTSTDHIVPAAEGGTSEWSNLQALCGPHHREKTGPRESQSGEAQGCGRKASRQF